MQIYFIRHGETDWNRLEKIQGRVNNPLNEKGILQSQNARKIFEDIRLTHAYASTLTRAQETAQIITADRGFEVICDERLVERDFGVLEGANHESYYVFNSEDEMPESIERSDVIYARVQSFFDELVSKHESDDAILVAAHAHTIRTWAEKTFPADFLFSTRLYNCQGVSIEYKDKAFHYCGLTEKIDIVEE